MKHKIIALLSIMSLIAGCSKNLSDENEYVFDTENIKSISISYPGSREGTEVPENDLDEMIEWLRTFTVGEKADKISAPGTDSISVVIEYVDGTVFMNGLSTMEMEGVRYYIEGAEAPECYYDLFE